MVPVNISFKLAYNIVYYMKKSIEKLRQMRTTYDQDYEQDGPSICDHTFKQQFILDGENLVFTPPLYNSIDGKPNSELSGLKLHLREIKVGRILNISSCLHETMEYALVKWPNDLPGLLFGIVPVDIFEQKNEIYQNPYTGEIPDRQNYQAPLWPHDDPRRLPMAPDGPRRSLVAPTAPVWSRYGPRWPPMDFSNFFKVLKRNQTYSFIKSKKSLKNDHYD
jgi:hypothetical protein